MAVSNVLPKIEYTADGVLTDYTYPFRILASEDIKVYIDDVEQGSGFTVDGINDENGGTITFATAPANNTKVTFQRLVDKTRSIDFVNGGKMDANTFDYDMDRTVMMVQDQTQVVEDRVVIATEERVAAQAAQTAAETAQTNSETAETAAVVARTGAETAETAAATSAANAATSESNTATSAANAATSESNTATSEANASSSATAAATSATSSSNSATAAATSASNAATSESNAATSAANAATSESNAATSAANAATSESVVQSISNDINFNNIYVDGFMGDGVTEQFTLSQSSFTERVIVDISGVIQTPSVSFNVVGTTLTFTSPPPNGDMIIARNIVSVIEHGNSHTHSQYASLIASSEPTTDNTYNLGSATKRFANVHAVTFEGTSTSAQYADLAEKYEADANYAAGTVVGFGGSKEITANLNDADPRVAGVISTAPAYLMNSRCEGDITLPVALTGRVPCRVTGEIKKGDMIVSAGNGVGRAEANPKVGTVIGKALNDFNGRYGTIEVVVGRD